MLLSYVKLFQIKPLQIRILLGVLFTYSPPVPRPCGNSFSNEEANWAIVFKPTFDSSAEVIHQGIFNFSASRIHSVEPTIPPCKLGLSIMYWGLIYVNKLLFALVPLTPINSSSSAMGIGVCEHKDFISSNCPGAIGCSIE